MRFVTTAFLTASLLGGILAAEDQKDHIKAQVLSAIYSTDVYARGEPFRLEAHARLMFEQQTPGTYKLFWASPERWREEIRAGDFEEVWVRNGNNQWISRNLGYPPLRVQELRDLFGSKHPVNVTNKDIKHTEQRKTSGIDLNCAEFIVSDPGHSPSSETLCVNATTGAPVIREIRLGRGEHKVVAQLEGYSAFGDRQYPRSLRVTEDRSMVVESSVDRLAAESLDASLFSPLEGVDAWPTCDDVKHPESIHTPDPEYTDEARKRRIQGVVTLYALIGAEGTVRKTAVLRRLEPGLDNQAENAVFTWKFKPALCGTLPVPSEITVDVSFRLFR